MVSQMWQKFLPETHIIKEKEGLGNSSAANPGLQAEPTATHIETGYHQNILHSWMVIIFHKPVNIIKKTEGGKCECES